MQIPRDPNFRRMSPADVYRREQDLIEQLATKQITKDQFCKLWAELKGDWHDAQTEANMIEESNERN